MVRSDHPWISKILINVLQVLSTQLLGEELLTPARSYTGVLGGPAELRSRGEG